MKLKIAPQARADIRVARRWWAENREKAPQLLGDELKRAFALLKTQPLIGERAVDGGGEGFRRFYLQGTRYFIYYAVHRSEVDILRLWAASRGARPSE